MDPIRFDIGGGGGSQVSFSMAPATTSVMPGLDVSDSGAAATSAPVRFEGFGMGDAVSTAPPEPAKPEAAPKARGLTGKVQLLIAGVAAGEQASSRRRRQRALAQGPSLAAWRRSGESPSLLRRGSRSCSPLGSEGSVT